MALFLSRGQTGDGVGISQQGLSCVLEMLGKHNATVIELPLMMKIFTEVSACQECPWFAAEQERAETAKLKVLPEDCLLVGCAHKWPCPPLSPSVVVCRRLRRS